MKIGDLDMPNLVSRRSGGSIRWYWVPPPAARGIFTSTTLGKELNAKALEKYAERQQSLERWRAERNQMTAVAAGPRAGTIDWLLACYMAAPWFQKNDEKTKRDYRNKLLALANFRLIDGERFGSKMWREVEPLHTDALHQMFCRTADGLRLPYARAVMHQYRIVWNWAKRYLWREFEQNPFEDMRLEAPDPRKIKWEPGQVLRFCRKAEELGQLSVAVAAMFCYELGQRVGDARRLTRGAFEGKRIRVVQHKTDTELMLPVSEVLLSYVEKVPIDQRQLVLNERTGDPYQDYELSKAAAKIREAAELPSHLFLMDLRRTCLSELGDLGATDDELMSVSGHATRQMLTIYSVRSYKRALAAMQRRWDSRNTA